MGQYHLAIVIPKDYEKSLSLFFLSILFLSFMSIIILILLFLVNKLAPTISNLVIFSNLGLLFLLPIHIFISGLYLSLRYLNSRNNSFGNSAKSSVINSGITYFSQILLGTVFVNGIGLIYGSIFGSLIGTLFLLFVSIRFISIKSFSLTKVRKVMYEYKKFPLITTLGTLIGGVAQQLPVILLSTLFGTLYSGFYSIANKAISIPSRIVATSISEVSYKHTSSIIKDDKLLSNYIEKSTAAVFQLLIIPFLIILLFGKSLVIIFLGNQWEIAGVYIQILSPFVFFQILGSPIGIYLQKNRNDLLFKWETIYLICSIFGLGSGYFFGNPLISVLNFSLLGSMCYILSIYLNFRLANASFRKMLFNIKNTFYLKKALQI